MSEEDLVKAYVEGRVSRRVFVRRLVAGGLSVSAAIIYGEVLRPGHAAAATSNTNTYNPDPLHHSNFHHRRP